MSQTAVQPISFDEFLAWYPSDGQRYELTRGEIVEVKPIGDHELVTSFLSEELTLEIRRLRLPYLPSRNTLVKPDRAFEGELPDLIVLDKIAVHDDPYWKKFSTISLGKSAKLVIEVVSTNWQDDYAHKLVDYERLGIEEYWIVDYLGLGGVRYIGAPKQPTITVYQLFDGEYQGEQFRRGEQIRSRIFAELNLATDQIFDNAR